MPGFGPEEDQMPSLDVKICGLSTPESVKTALAGGATHVGFIFFAKSPRNVTPDEAMRLAEIARGRAKIVAVTVNAADSFLDGIVRTVRPDMLQLHGTEPPERVAAVRARYGLPVIKAFAVRDSSDLDALKRYFGIADRFLLDAKPPEGAQLPGGNGVAFDWSLLDGLDPRIPYMLSGGVNRSNLRAALTQARPAGIDVSSGLEKAPGVKDEGLIREFLDEVRRIESEVAA